MRSKSPVVILDVILILLFLVSLIRVPSETQYFDDASDLGQVIRKVQDLTKQAEKPNLQHFQEAFQAAVQAMKVTAGLTTVVRVNSNQDGAGDIVVSLRTPYLLPPMVALLRNTLHHSLSIPSYLVVDTSVSLTLDTPPPITG